MSMKIEHLSECKGASKYGNCVNCGIESKNGKDLTWISFSPNNGGYHATICLCRQCRFELVTEIMTDAIRKDGEKREHDVGTSYC